MRASRDAGQQCAGALSSSHSSTTRGDQRTLASALQSVTAADPVTAAEEEAKTRHSMVAHTTKANSTITLNMRTFEKKGRAIPTDAP